MQCQHLSDAEIGTLAVLNYPTWSQGSALYELHRPYLFIIPRGNFPDGNPALFLPRKAGCNGPVLPSLTYKLDGIFDKIVPSQPSSSFVVASSNTSTLELHGTLSCHFIRRTRHSVHHPGAQERWEKVATRTGSRIRNPLILSLVPPTSSARAAS